MRVLHRLLPLRRTAPELGLPPDELEGSRTVNNKYSRQVILGVLWLIVGLWTLVGVEVWVGIAMCLLGLAYLAYATIQHRKTA